MSGIIHLSGEIKFVSGKDIPVIKSMQCLKKVNVLIKKAWLEKEEDIQYNITYFRLVNPGHW